jgi:hypothetical protein
VIVGCSAESLKLFEIGYRPTRSDTLPLVEVVLDYLEQRSTGRVSIQEVAAEMIAELEGLARRATVDGMPDG